VRRLSGPLVLAFLDPSSVSSSSYAPVPSAARKCLGLSGKIRASGRIRGTGLRQIVRGAGPFRMSRRRPQPRASPATETSDGQVLRARVRSCGQLSWLIRAWRLFRGVIAHPINRGAPINHNRAGRQRGDRCLAHRGTRPYQPGGTCPGTALALPAPASRSAEAFPGPVRAALQPSMASWRQVLAHFGMWPWSAPDHPQTRSFPSFPWLRAPPDMPASPPAPDPPPAQEDTGSAEALTPPAALIRRLV
jgi:hypothetical protein